MQLNVDGLAAGAGMWEMSSEQLERYREAVDDGAAGTDLERIVDGDPEGRRRGDGTRHAQDRPKGYPKDHPRIELLRFKGIVAWREWPAGAWLGSAKAKDRVVELFRTAEPLNVWLASHVG